MMNKDRRMYELFKLFYLRRNFYLGSLVTNYNSLVGMS